MYESIIEKTESFFSAKLSEFGSTPKGVDWSSIEAQEIRFHQLARVISETPDEKFSICDYGCGYGAFYPFIAKSFPNIAYIGYDISETMINKAKAELQIGNNNVSFCNASRIETEYDYIIESGIFNKKMDTSDEEWKEYIIDILNMFDRCSRKGFAFNCLTSYSDKEYMRDDLYYADPLFFFDYAKKNFSRNVALLHDYEIYDFTILVRK